MILVLPHQRVHSWPGHGFALADRGLVLPPADALTRSWDSDAHFTGYAATKGAPWPWRLSRAAVGRLPIEMQLAIFDIDAPGHAPTEAFRFDLCERAAELFRDWLPGGFFYETRGGGRLVWRLAAPFPITSVADEEEWSARYLLAVDRLARGFGIKADRACADWTRMFRLPRATRDPGGAPEEPIALGDPELAGGFELPKPPEDPKPPRQRKPGKNTTPRPPASGSSSQDHAGGRGAVRAGLLPLLEQRGLVIREHSDRAVVIRCPNAESHTTGSDGDGSSIFYLPKAGGDGAIHCLHSGCRDLTLPEWRGMLGIATITRWARIVKSHVNVEADGAILIVVELAPVDGGAELPWLRADSRSPRRWDSLWDAADLETPDPAKPAEVAIQARGLQDAILALEVESGKVRRIFAAAVAA